MDWRSRSSLVAFTLSLALVCSPVAALATSEEVAGDAEQSAVELVLDEETTEETPAEEAPSDDEENVIVPDETGDELPSEETPDDAENPADEEEPTEPSDSLTEQEDPPTDGWYTTEVDGVSYTYYYKDSSNVVGPYEVEGKLYFFDETTGARVEKAGWLQDSSGDWYYVNADFTLKTGWFKYGNSWYYLNPEDSGRMVTDSTFVVSGVTYVAASDGTCPANKWVQAGGAWYYTNNNSATRTGWLKSGGTWYYLDPADGGKMVDGALFTVKGVTYVAKQGGACPANSWVKIDGDWYYTNSSCAVSKGWVKSGGRWYYLDPANNGKMATGWIEVGGKRYYLESSGAMATGWKKLDGSYYYLNPSGDAAMKWKNIGGNTYYFEPPTGAMVAGCKKTIGGQEYEFLDSGALKSGWVKEGGKWYWYQPNGDKLTGWIQDKGTWYYLDPANGGAMVTGWLKIDGKWNAFDKSSGAWRTDNSLFINGINYANTYGSRTNYFILVDDSKTKVMIYHWEGGEWMPYKMWSCSTGYKTTPTPKGRFSILYKQYTFGNNHHQCYYASCFAAGDYLFHSTLYKPGSFEHLDATLNAHISMGCVRLAIENAKWIYDNIPYGTGVYIH